MQMTDMLESYWKTEARESGFVKAAEIDRRHPDPADVMWFREAKA